MTIPRSMLLIFLFTSLAACSDDAMPALDSGAPPDQAVTGEAGTDLAPPDQAQSDQAASDQATADQATADQAPPDQAAPDQGSPDLAKPDLAKPDMPPASSCISGGKKVTPTGAGTCASPYKVDLSSTKIGDVVYIEVPGTAGADEKKFGFPSYAGCTPAPTNTARDIVFALTLPSSGHGHVWVHADAAAGADPIAIMLEDQSCGQPANACSNKNGKGQEECLKAKKGGTGYFGNKPYAVVSELAHSNKPLTVRFKMVP